MKKQHIILLLLIAVTTTAFAQSHEKEIKKFQKELNKEYKSPKESPLDEEQRASFTKLPFFPINANYRVEAKFIRVKKKKTLRMKTSANQMQTYDKYAEVVFQLEGKRYRLNVYQSHTLRRTKEYKDYLFLPFTDLTSGNETYGGGRYIDLKIPKGNTIIIDFNKAYHPYCAYSDRYSCPIPPRENRLEVRIEAGVRNPEEE